MAIFYLLVVSMYRSLIYDPMSSGELFYQGMIAFFISAAIFWGAPWLKLWMERILRGFIQSDKKTALVELQTLPTMLSDLEEEGAIAKVTCEKIKHSLEVSGVAFFAMSDVFDSHYSCEFKIGDFSRSLDDYEITTDSPIIDALSSQPECIVIERVYGELSDRFYQELVRLRNELGLSVLVPIFANHEIYGFILVTEPSQPKIWNDEEIASLFNIGAQIGLNLRARDFERRSSEVDKLVSLGTMAAGLAHEIRNPLVSVQTLASLMRAGKSVENLPDDFKNVILRDVKRIESIVDGVSMYSKNQKGKKVPIPIEEVIETSIDINKNYALEKSVQVSFKHDVSGGAMVRGNFDQLVQVFNNLIENAIYALQGVPKPEVKISMVKRQLRRREMPQWVEVMISDNGTGIPEAIRSRVFDPFTTSKDTGSRDDKKGMGLGLAISKRIIENHSGAITVSNNNSGGATFVVSMRSFNAQGGNE